MTKIYIKNKVKLTNKMMKELIGNCFLYDSDNSDSDNSESYREKLIGDISYDSDDEDKKITKKEHILK